VIALGLCAAYFAWRRWHRRAELGPSIGEMLLTPVANVTVSGSAAPDAPTADAPPANVFRKEGDMWRVVFQGSTAYFKPINGFFYLAQLLRSPDAEIAVEQLRRLDDVPPRASARHTLLDAAAVRTYHARLHAMTEERVEATRDNDIARIGALDREVEMIEHLLGNADRPFGELKEKDRVAVRNSIERALRKIRKSLPALGTHMKNTLEYGTTPCYRPPPETRWDVDW
jgi:hypothetical protein